MILVRIFKGGELTVELRWLDESSESIRQSLDLYKSFTVFADTGGRIVAWTADSHKHPDAGGPNTDFRDMMKAIGMPAGDTAKRQRGPEDA